MTLLSKSTYLMGLQCPKLLWHRYHAKELLQQPGTLAMVWLVEKLHELAD